VHAPLSTRGAFTALCALLPARSKKVLGALAGDEAAHAAFAQAAVDASAVVAALPGAVAKKD
jgi:hypothetical protein